MKRCVFPTSARSVTGKPPHRAACEQVLRIAIAAACGLQSFGSFRPNSVSFGFSRLPTARIFFFATYMVAEKHVCEKFPKEVRKGRLIVLVVYAGVGAREQRPRSQLAIVRYPRSHALPSVSPWRAKKGGQSVLHAKDSSPPRCRLPMPARGTPKSSRVSPAG